MKTTFDVKRRSFIRNMSFAGFAANTGVFSSLLIGCGDDSGVGNPNANPGTTDANGGAGEAPTSVPGAPAFPALTQGCVLTPEETEGPYCIDVNLVRQDITEGQPGLALALRLVVVDASSCSPIAGKLVEIWHANATDRNTAPAQVRNCVMPRTRSCVRIRLAH